MNKKQKITLAVAAIGGIVLLVAGAITIPKLIKSKDGEMLPVYTPTQIVEEQMKECKLTENEMFAVITEYFDVLNKDLEAEKTKATVYISDTGAVMVDVTAPKMVQAEDHTPEMPHYIPSEEMETTVDAFESVWSSVQNAYAWLYQNKAVDLEGNIIEFETALQNELIDPTTPTTPEEGNATAEDTTISNVTSSDNEER